MEEESKAYRDAAASEAKVSVEYRKKVLAHVGPNAYTADEFHKLNQDDWTHTDGRRDDFTSGEVQLAKRCHGMHLELLKMDTTPVSSHYELIHYDVPILDATQHKLEVKGMVQQPMTLTINDIKLRPSETHSVMMCCAGTGRSLQNTRYWTHVPWGPDSVGCSKWTGCSLADLLTEAGPLEGASGGQVIFTGADKGVEAGQVQYFQRSLSLEDAMKGHVLLCYGQNGQDLSPAHGYPLRIIVPGWYGMASVKWLTSIEVVPGDNSWWGHQMKAYSYTRSANDPNAVPIQQLPVRALMAPPGYAEFFSRTRLVAPGTVRIHGKVWAGAVDVDRVEFSSNNGKTWQPTVLKEKNASFGWASWYVDWEAEEGTTTVLCCRAFTTSNEEDGGEMSQDLPNEQMFNYGSFGSTQPQQVYVKVTKLIDTVGSNIDLTSEIKAAKLELYRNNQQEADCDESPRLMSDEHRRALYQAPGSQ